MAKDGILWTSSQDGEAHQTCLLASAESLQRSLRHKNCRETAPLGLLARLLTQSPVLLRARLQGPRADVTPEGCPEGGLPPPLGSRREEEREPGASEPCASLGFKGESSEGDKCRIVSGLGHPRHIWSSPRGRHMYL